MRLLSRSRPVIKTIFRSNHSQPIVPKKPTNIQKLNVPDEDPTIPRKHVFQQLKRPSSKDPIYTLDKASEWESTGTLKYYKYPSLASYQSDPLYTITGVDNRDTLINQFPSRTDFLVVGSGLVGSATAYYIKKRVSRAGDVLVIDKDPYTPHNSTAICNGLLSAQSKSRDIARVATLSKELIRALRTDVLFDQTDYAQLKYRPCTHLILWSENEVGGVLDSIDNQAEDGIYTEAKLPAELETLFPWLKAVDTDIFLGTHGNQDEALIDPIGLRNVYRTLAQAHGVHFLLAEAIDFNTVRSFAEETISPWSAVNIVARNPSTGELRSIGYANALLALGHNSAFLESRAELEPYMKNQYGDLHFIRPKLRIQFTFKSIAAPTLNFPVITDTDGSMLIKDDFAGDFKYCLTYEESDNFLDYEVQFMDLESDDPYVNYYHNSEIFENYFNDKIKPRLVKRIPSMEDAEFLLAFSGYESQNIHDGSPIIGPHPYHENLYFCVGQGSRMLNFSPASAACLSELMLTAEEETFDMTQFYWNRVFRGRKINEFKNLIR